VSKGKGIEVMASRTVEQSEIGRRPSWRLSGGLAIAAVVGVAMLFVGSAAASPLTLAKFAVTDKSPYSGTAYGYLFDAIKGCGTTTSVPVLPFFNLTKGRAIESVAETAHSCSTQNGSAEVEAEAEFVSSPFLVTTGLHHVSINWVANFSVKLAASAGSSGSQAAEGGFSEFVDAELVDLTNGSAFYPSINPSTSVYIQSGTFSQAYPHVHQTDYINATLSSTHSYELIVDVTASAYVFVTPGTSTASASLNMGSGGRGASLSSIVIK